jgi:hypothetical protein
MQTAPWRYGRGLPIEALFAWLATEADGGQIIATVNLSVVGGSVQLVGADVDAVRAMRPYAEAMRRATGCSVRLVRFDAAQGMEELP